MAERTIGYGAATIYHQAGPLSAQADSYHMGLKISNDDLAFLVRSREGKQQEGYHSTAESGHEEGGVT